MSSRFVSAGTILAGSDGRSTTTTTTGGVIEGAAATTAGGPAAGRQPLNKSGIVSAVGLGSAGGEARPQQKLLQQETREPHAQSHEPTTETTASPSPSSLSVVATTTATDPATQARQAEWAAVQASLESERREREARRRAEAQGEGEKSLFAILQENKAAKQAAFEEANRIRNQFRALDDDEIEFLDGVKDRKRAEEERRRREVEEGLAAFREAQKGGAGAGAGQDGAVLLEGAGDGGATTAATAGDAEVSWEHSGRKRKREKDGSGAVKIGGLKGVKRKTSVPEGGSSGTAPEQQKKSQADSASPDKRGAAFAPATQKSEQAPAKTTGPVPAPKAKASLVAYGSDDSDED
ncbi:N-terminal domain of NEFA-interacting nuclear protein NIP30-domain-containing protein [Microdochium trichocladiopsis]|uniref:N-terminal domain of NEFA-interacting nuclear protein NIP30-domain-containing protein n=1 Tax=Microdochium trichocladiopsis TaxID=1682393 RepID=A0A9P8YIK2_9PEZI|nr:N-terminal domain of NEFA-interacting nuclear protein NIP30-domain-containing protein [Microdochium trichocladiopsis]KAH7039669.1 N-terminal domain of NEFA-interacting nuclear protein NIP30-domain-containing protein [Microdochium trichocladiopsis]